VGQQPTRRETSVDHRIDVADFAKEDGQLVEVPVPAIQRGPALVSSAASLVSAGTGRGSRRIGKKQVTDRDMFCRRRERGDAETASLVTHPCVELQA
jgi:hypothetical protein